MAPDDHNGARPAGPVVLRIKLRYDDVEAMVQRFASNVGKSGLFLPTRSIQPIGTEVKFELRLANNTPVLVGMGRVKYAKHPDPDNPRAAFGMAIELMRVSREGRGVIIRMIERRRALGLPDVAIPLPEDLEAARRSEVETVPRGDTSGVVRDAMAHVPSVPPSEQLIGKEPASGPIGVAKSEPTRPSSPLLTSARTGSGSIPVVRDDHSARVPVPVLAPERSRPRRPRVQELIDKASELSAPIIAALPVVELDMHVDLDNVLSRARELAGGDLEVELATLREAAAAPIEISVEAASAELARQLGGKAVAKRERSGSARWAPPPAIETRGAHAVDASAAQQVRDDAHAQPAGAQAGDAHAAPDAPLAADFSSKMRAQTEAAPSATIAAVVEAAVARVPDPDAASTHQTSYDEVLRAEAAAAVDDDDETPVIAGDDYVEAFVPRAPTPIDDEAIDPDTVPPTSASQLTDIKTEPTGNRALMIDDDADVSSFERALDEPADLLASGEYQLADDAVERTQIGPAGGFGDDEPSIPDQLAAQLDQQLAEAEQELERELAAEAMAGVDEEQEISDLDVIAEADEEDEDLLAAHGEAEVSGAHVAAPHAYDDSYAAPQPVDDFAAPQAIDDFAAPQAIDDFAARQQIDHVAAPQPVDDFAERLDLGEDDDAPPSDEFDHEAAREFDDEAARALDHEGARAFDHEAAREFDAQATVAAPGDYIEHLQQDYAAAHREPPVAQRSSRHRRPSSESSYTFAENVPEAGLQLAGESAGEEFDEPHSYAPAPQRHAPAAAPTPAPLAGPDPRLLRYGRATTASTEDLEDALAALDVDFDNLSVDQRRNRRAAPSSSGPRPLPGLPIEKPATGQHPIVGRSPTGQHEALRKPPTGQHEALRKPPTGQHEALRKPPTGQHEPLRTTSAGPVPGASVPATARSVAKRATKPPPIPAAARRPPTRQVPVVAAPVKRATTDDDGVLIDFDDDE